MNVQAGAVKPLGMFAKSFIADHLRSNLVQVIGRPSTYCIPVKKCVTTIVQQIQLSVRILNVIGM